MDKKPLDGDVLARIVNEVVMKVPPEESALAPMTKQQLDFRRRVEPQIAAIIARGGIVDVGAFVV